MLFSNLSVNQEYLLKIQALTSSLYQENLVYPGVISEVSLKSSNVNMFISISQVNSKCSIFALLRKCRYVLVDY